MAERDKKRGKKKPAGPPDSESTGAGASSKDPESIGGKWERLRAKAEKDEREAGKGLVKRSGSAQPPGPAQPTERSPYAPPATAETVSPYAPKTPETGSPFAPRDTPETGSPYAPPAAPQESSPYAPKLPTAAEAAEFRLAASTLLDWGDNAPRFVPTTEPGDAFTTSPMAAAQRAPYLSSAALEQLEVDNQLLDDLMIRYAADFDDEGNRLQLEELAERLGRLDDLVSAASRLLTVHEGLDGEHRIRSHMHAWEEHARRNSPATSRSGEIDVVEEIDAEEVSARFDEEEEAPELLSLASDDLLDVEETDDGDDDVAEEDDAELVPASQTNGGFVDPTSPDAEEEPLASESGDDTEAGTRAAPSIREKPRFRSSAPPVSGTAIQSMPTFAVESSIPPPPETEASLDPLPDAEDDAPLTPRSDGLVWLAAKEKERPETAKSERGPDSHTKWVRQTPVGLEEESSQEMVLDVEDLVAEQAALPTDEEDIVVAPTTPRSTLEVPAAARRSVHARTPAAGSPVIRADKPAPAAPPSGPARDLGLMDTGELDLALAATTDDAERGRILVARAKRELSRGDRARAIDSFRDALTFDTTNRAAIEALEHLYRESKNTTRLAEVLETKLELAKSDALRAEGLVALAVLYENDLRDLGEAISRLELAHSLAPRSTDALDALARCREKVGDFEGALEALDKLRNGETSRSEKLEILLRMASLQETRLGDLESAISTYEVIITEHPQYRAAFDDLERLSELSGGWKAKALLLEHQVETSKEPKRQAQLLVEVGDLMAHPDRDPEGAKKHYERAARVFPSSPGAWRGLVVIAMMAGDAERAEFCLEQRVRHTSDLTERALALIDLGNHRMNVMNKVAEAQQAFEQAYRTDANNAAAASALLVPFISQKRWTEAGELCEVLYNDALAAADEGRMLAILETSWQVACATGNTSQMLVIAAARYRLAPIDERMRDDLINAAHGALDDPDALRRAKHSLDIALDRTGDDPQMLSRIGEVFAAAGESSTAERCFERVLASRPTDAAALGFLSAQAESRGDFRRGASLKERFAREVHDDDRRFELLLSAGDLWVRARGIPSALRAYEEALTVRPREPVLLETLLGIYTDMQNWPRVASMQRALADIETDPSRKGMILVSLAAVLEEHLNEGAAAADALEEALEVDDQRLDAFERLTRVLTLQKDWMGLATAYRQMIARLDEKKDPKLAFVLYHQLGLVYRDRVGDAERALKAFTQAATIRPDDLEARKIVTELLVVTERLDSAVEVARATLLKDPLQQRLYRDLYELFLRAHAYDKAWCVAEAMSVLGPLTDTERQFVEDYPPVDASEIPASLIATAWPTHIHHYELDRTLSSALQIAVAVYLRARLQQAAPPALSVPLEQDPSPEASRVLTAFRNAAEILACTIPALHGTLVPGPLFTTVLAHAPTINISLSTSSTVSTDLLNFLATKRLAEQQSALRARSLFPSVQELKQLFFTTTQLATQGPTQMMRPGWDGGLGAVMTAEERAALRGLVAGVASSGQKLDVKRWLQLAEVSAMRAGLLICGSVLTAQRAMGLEPRAPDDLPPQAWLGELGMYAVSEQYFELSETIHVAI